MKIAPLIRRAVPVAVACACMVMLALVSLSQQSSPFPPPSTSTLPSTRTPPPDSAYAGDQACASCHEKEARTYFATPHYLDSGMPSAKNILGSFTPGKNVLRTANPDLIFAMIAADDGYYESAVNIRDPQKLTGEAQKIDIVVGSGRHGQTYLYWKGDQLFELPVSYWTYTHQWINSPGYVDGQVNFTRPIGPRCLECHATRFDSTPPPANRYAPPSVVLGIGCERCHGPGGEHVARERGPDPPKAGSAEMAIVNPAHLERDRQLDLCALCHAGAGEAIGASLTFKVGDPIAEFVKITAPPANTPVDVHGNQVGALEASRCFTSGKLTCSTCHNVHTTQQNASAFSVHCLECHDAHACGRFRQMGESIRGKCIECHMPIGDSQALTTASRGGVMHAEMRSHRIAIYPQAK